MRCYGPVTVTGNVSVGDDVITRTLAFKPGNRFSLATIQLSQRRLYDLGLFQLATVSPRTEEVADGLVPVQVTVAEAKHRQIRLGAGYGSEERPRGEAEWKHVNFFGGARTAHSGGQVFVARSRTARQLHAAVSVQPQGLGHVLSSGLVSRTSRPSSSTRTADASR